MFSGSLCSHGLLVLSYVPRWPAEGVFSFVPQGPMEVVFSFVPRELTGGVFCYVGGPGECVFSFVPQWGRGKCVQLCPPGAHRRGVLLRRGARGMGV